MLSEVAKMVLALGVPICLAMALLYAMLRGASTERKPAKARTLPIGAVTALRLTERADAEKRLRDEDNA